MVTRQRPAQAAPAKQTVIELIAIVATNQGEKGSKGKTEGYITDQNTRDSSLPVTTSQKVLLSLTNNRKVDPESPRETMFYETEQKLLIQCTPIANLCSIHVPKSATRLPEELGSGSTDVGIGYKLSSCFRVQPQDGRKEAARSSLQNSLSGMMSNGDTR